MEQYLIDTNVISDYFSASLNDTGIRFMDSVIDAIPQISVVTQIELLCWKTKIELENSVKDFIGDSRVLNITDSVILHCVNIRKSKRIKTPDAIIAATALAYSCILITNNIGDFRNIKGLKLINPHIL